MYHVDLNTLADTDKLGSLLGEQALAGDLLCLDGDLGAGKTTLVQAIARALGEESWVNSPSFAILQEYAGGRLPLYHMDFYRLGSSNEVLDLGLNEYFTGSGLTVIEWAERAAEILPEKRIHLHIRHGKQNSRLVEICASGEDIARVETLLQAFQANRSLS